jgi:hypothetical protein
MARRAGVAMPCGGRHVHVVHALTARKKYQLRSPRRKKAWPRTSQPTLTTSPPLRYTCRSRKLTSYRAISHLAAKAAPLSEKACRAHRAHAVGTLPGLPSRGTALGVCSGEHSPTGAAQASACTRAQQRSTLKMARESCTSGTERSQTGACELRHIRLRKPKRPCARAQCRDICRPSLYYGGAHF